MPRPLIAALALLLAGCATAQPPGTPTSEAPAAELSDADLQARWWTWALASPQERNPVADETGQFCAEDQPKDVWFFAGTFGGRATRTCEVPADRPLAGPAVNHYSANTTDCKKFMEAAKGSVTLDGQVVELRRIDPVEVRFDAAKDNAAGERAGRIAAQACGLWAWLKPLTPGEHELRIEGESGGLGVAVTYQLKVKDAG
ncbi:hypothetical protein ABZ345_38245 [Lentzea sp. NPDC005914]|uniref:hypothetical protein n=1 Tax=Lentzea sp. NPDC005914 TaxID=3154572 RepID=UPI0033E651CF